MSESGEVCDNCQPLLTALQDEVAGMRHTCRSQASTIGRLKRKAAENGREHPDWQRCKDLFVYWQRVTGKTRSKFTADRFKTAQPYLNEYDDEQIKRAIRGLAYDPFVSRRRNGTEERHVGWHTLFKDGDRLEEYANRASLHADTLEDDAENVEAVT